MSTSIKAALRKWEEASGQKAAEAKEIKCNLKLCLIKDLEKTLFKLKINPGAIFNTLVFLSRMNI